MTSGAGGTDQGGAHPEGDILLAVLLSLAFVLGAAATVGLRHLYRVFIKFTAAYRFRDPWTRLTTRALRFVRRESH